MNTNMRISSSPHIHSGRSTTKIMLDVIIALLPTTVVGIIIFGLRSLAVIGVCLAFCVFSEFLFNKISKKKQTVGNLSAVVTGLLLALNLPVNIPLWQCAVGSIFAIIIVKCIFGGMGKNIVNPAITARVFMILSFGTMAKSAYPVDAVSSATPLVSIKEGNAPDLLTLFLGNHGGTIGEVCSVAIIIGGIYLLIKNVIKWYIPVSYIGATFVFYFLFGGFDAYASLAGVLAGGLLIGAVFMATDYVTSPSTSMGKIIFGVGAGFITVIIRLWGNYPDGVSFAILLMNIITPYIDKLTPRKLFGGEKI